MIGDAPERCSASRCAATPAWRVNWRNPRLHDVDRVKVWLACDDHRASLRDYLATRGFPVVVTGRDEVLTRVPDPVDAREGRA